MNHETPIDLDQFSRARRARWRYGRKTRRIRVSADVAAQLEREGMARRVDSEAAR